MAEHQTDSKTSVYISLMIMHHETEKLSQVVEQIQGLKTRAVVQYKEYIRYFYVVYKEWIPLKGMVLLPVI